MTEIIAYTARDVSESDVVTPLRPHSFITKAEGLATFRAGQKPPAGGAA